ncbi:hypothetical protein [Pseudoalteromonas denitrificans]|uniref:Uncharacterized protein n=1 Tax=Pseudoalteromonas denitrificans DSM 6059 TaxID=1123010 RepID=A0A1I1PJW5_9GAMM|nr:hypothetical protein [Pseudoalteromonas denitrificans]SFD10134.1 hypothetical protein SAMN02745724_03493 [Pseudoalteromonas denitrificans DSM 6059]
MSNKLQLIEQYNDGSIGKTALGQLRRMMLNAVLSDISRLPDNEVIKYLNKKRSKIELKSIADKVGYGIEPVNIRQTFKAEISGFTQELIKRGLLKVGEKSSVERNSETVTALKEFITKRLQNEKYEWPVNLKGLLYRKALWAYFLDTPVDEVKYVSPLFSRDDEVRELLEVIDIKIVNGEVKTISYVADSALDEMQDTMTSRALSTLRQEMIKTQNKLMASKEENRQLKREIKQYEEEKKRMLTNNKSAFKAGSIH